MKLISISSLLLCFALLSCTKEGEFTQSMNYATSLENSILLSEGTFAPTSGISVDGGVEIRILNTDHILLLKNFEISEGPDLKVYLSKSDSPNDFVNLGSVENNKTTYAIPAEINLAEYPYVLIHCQQYNHLFAIANLN